MPDRDIIDEYLEVLQSIGGSEDKAGQQLAHAIWLRMTAEQQREIRSATRKPCRGYDESCRPRK